MSGTLSIVRTCHTDAGARVLLRPFPNLLQADRMTSFGCAHGSGVGGGNLNHRLRVKPPLLASSRIIASLAVAGAGAALAACGMLLPDAYDQPSAITGNPPRQVLIKGTPEVRRHPDPDSMVFYVEVVARDSTPHLQWTPATALVETDRGYKEEALLVPYACLRPSDLGMGYPFNYEWMTCNRVGINNNSILSPGQIREIEEAVDGTLVAQFNFRSRPGAAYQFRVPVGQAQVAEAIRRVDQLPYTDETYHVPNAPICVLADVVPPPPCPPWLLAKKYHYTTGAASGDTLPVSPNGWIRVTYTLPDGSVRVRQKSMSGPE